MIRRASLAVAAGLVLAAAATAQAAGWQFRWQPGQVLTYRTEQTTAIEEKTADGKVEVRDRLALTKRWQVLAVDPAGVATLQLSLAALRKETTTPSGDVLFFDSANLEKSEPQLRDQLKQYVDTPLAVLRVDGKGRVVEVKESRFGPASKFEAELPFRITLPDAVPQSGQAWERTYKITVEPPQGTGEQYDAVQKCVCKAINGAAATIGVAAAVKTLPSSVADQAPLLQSQPEGEAVFDLQNGRLQSVSLHVDKELKGHQGEGSSYHFQSNYNEQFAGAN
jgi:hypothetical protein